VTARPAAGTGVMYHRDSEGAADCAPQEYVAWAARRAAELGVSFAGTPDQMAALIRRRGSVEGGLYLDYGVSGNELDRPGLNALFRRVETDRSASHVLIPRRDRFARPDHPIDAILLERELQFQGLTLVYMDRLALPIRPGQPHDLAGDLPAFVDFHVAGSFRPEHAQKVLCGLVRLARCGFSGGGPPRTGSSSGWFGRRTTNRSGGWSRGSARRRRGTTSAGCRPTWPRWPCWCA
jgi:hypothetical protein